MIWKHREIQTVYPNTQANSQQQIHTKGVIQHNW